MLNAVTRRSASCRTSSGKRAAWRKLISTAPARSSAASSAAGRCTLTTTSASASTRPASGTRVAPDELYRAALHEHLDPTLRETADRLGHQSHTALADRGLLRDPNLHSASRNGDCAADGVGGSGEITGEWGRGKGPFPFPGS